MPNSTSQDRNEVAQDHEDNKNRHEEASIARVLKYTGLFGGVQVIYALIAIVRNKITAVLLGLVGMGLIENYNRTAEFLGASTNLGLSFSAVQHLARLHRLGHTRAIEHFSTLVRSWTLLAACLGFVITLFFAPLLSAFLWDDWRNVLTIAAVAPIVACSTLSGGEMATTAAHTSHEPSRRKLPYTIALMVFLKKGLALHTSRTCLRHCRLYHDGGRMVGTHDYHAVFAE